MTLKSWTCGAVLASMVGGCTIPGGAPFDHPKRVREPIVAPAGLTINPSGPTIAAGTLAGVDILNPRGSVRVLVDPGLSRASVEVRPWSQAGLSRGEARAIEESLDLFAETVIEDGQMVLRVRADTPMEREDLRIDVLVRTPESRTTTVRNAHGSVELVGVGGQIAVSSGEMGDGPGGEIRIRTDEPVEGPVYLSTSDGNIDVFMPGSSSGQLELVSDDGEVVVHLGEGHVTGAHPEDGRFVGLLNGGANTFYARTQRGRISLTSQDGNWSRPGTFEYGRGGRDR